MRNVFVIYHASGRSCRLPPLTPRPPSASFRAQGARDEHGARSWSREMDFNTSTANSNSNSPCRNGNTRRQFLGATTAPCTHLGLSELIRMCQSDVVTSYYDATTSPGDYWPLLCNGSHFRIRIRIRIHGLCRGTARQDGFAVFRH